MAKSIPYVAVMTASLSGSGNGSMSFQNSSGQRFIIHNILHKKTGACNITDISNNSSQRFSNASPSTPLDIEAFPDITAENDSLRDLPIPLELMGQESLRISLTDTSTSSNTVFIYLVGELVLG
jgi:hypothetical protein